MTSVAYVANITNHLNLYRIQRSKKSDAEVVVIFKYGINAASIEMLWSIAINATGYKNC